MTAGRAVLKFEQLVGLLRDFHTSIVTSHDTICDENERLRAELRNVQAAYRTLQAKAGLSDV